MPKYTKKLVAALALVIGISVVVPVASADAAVVKSGTSTTKTTSKDYWL